MVHVSLHVSPLLLYLSCIDSPAQSPDPSPVSYWGLCSLLLGLYLRPLHWSISQLCQSPGSVSTASTAVLGIMMLAIGLVGVKVDSKASVVGGEDSRQVGVTDKTIVGLSSFVVVAEMTFCCSIGLGSDLG